MTYENKGGCSRFRAAQFRAAHFSAGLHCRTIRALSTPTASPSRRRASPWAPCYNTSGVVSGTTVRALVPGRFGQKIENNRFERYSQRTNKNISNYKGG